MVILEMRGSSYDNMFDLIHKAKKGTKKTKLALCELEECLEHCYETDTNDYYEGESDYEGSEITDSDIDVNIDEFNYRRGMRKGMRDNMWHDDRYYDMRRPMRRRRSGRYSY